MISREEANENGLGAARGIVIAFSAIALLAAIVGGNCVSVW